MIISLEIKIHKNVSNARKMVHMSNMMANNRLEGYRIIQRLPVFCFERYCFIA